jgi:elongation factor Ts
MLQRFRLRSLATAIKPDLKLLARLRQEVVCPMTKAREALIVTKNDFTAAKQWLEESLLESGMKKAEKMAGRSTTQGVVAVAQSKEKGAVMIELNCETDFVGRSELFLDLADSIAKSVLKHLESPMTIDIALELLIEPGKTVKMAILEAIAKSGENIVLKRASVIVPEPNLYWSTYVHGHLGRPHVGRIGSMVAIHSAHEHAVLSNHLAKHVAGMNPLSVQGPEEPLLSQPFMFGNGTVQECLKEWSDKVKDTIAVKEFVRFELGQ